MGWAKSSEEGVSGAVGRRAARLLSLADIPHPRGTGEGGGGGCWQPNCRPGASVALSWANPLGPDTRGRGKRQRHPGWAPALERSHRQPLAAAALHSGARVTGARRAGAPRARLGSRRGYLLGVAVRVAPAQPGQSLAQLAHVHAAILVTIQLLEEATPALPPLRIARAPPHGARPGGEGRPGGDGLGGGFGAPPPPRGPAGPAPRPLPLQPPRCPPGSGTCRRR